MDNVLLPGEQLRLLQPCDGRTDPGVVGVVREGIPLEGSVLVFPQDFPRGSHHLVFEPLLPIQVAQRPENAVDFRPGEPGAGR